MGHPQSTRHRLAAHITGYVLCAAQAIDYSVCGMFPNRYKPQYPVPTRGRSRKILVLKKLTVLFGLKPLEKKLLKYKKETNRIYLYVYF